MRHAEDTSSYETIYETIRAIETARLTIKDVADRVNYFDNATVETVYLMGDKFYKVRHDKGVEYYNPPQRRLYEVLRWDQC